LHVGWSIDYLGTWSPVTKVTQRKVPDGGNGFPVYRSVEEH